MYRRQSLNGPWQLTHFDAYGETYDHRHLSAGLPARVWLDASVPGSVYLDLMQAGWIDDVLKDCNSLAAQWVEHQFWYYRRTINVDAPTPGRTILTLAGLDLDALIYLNGQLVGEHHNAFYPCRLDVTDALQPGDNELIARIDAGQIAIADQLAGPYNTETSAMLSKRALLRKPHYACRWDWAPRLMNVGIGGDVTLETTDTAIVEDVAITAVPSRDYSTATVDVRAHVFNPGDAHVALELSASIDVTNALLTHTQTVPPGCSVITGQLTLDNPRLWQPRGYGDPHLYTTRITVRAGDDVLHDSTRQVGVRSVRIDQPPATDGGHRFHLVINDRPIFCKGACWVPPSLIWPAATPDDYRALVDRAVEANMNMLRVWGGGTYAHPAMLEACDRAGILVWHDFSFSWSKFPGDDAFCDNVAAEARHVVRARAHHPSLVVWCGNNEVEIAVASGDLPCTAPDARPDKPIFFELLPKLLAEEDPTRPYRPTTPWSLDSDDPNDPYSGTQHPWLVALGPPKGDYWIYREDASRFCIEGGMLGPSTLPTLHEILPPDQRTVGSRVWLHHDNSQNTWRGESMLDNLLRINLRETPRALSFEDYVHYAGILHGEALETGIDNWRRRKFDSAAAVFWMFNDTWPAAVSWTPIDYARRRKPAFYYVKRAFAEIRTICVALADELAIFVVNDTPRPLTAALRWGLFALAGGLPVDERIEIDCPANAATIAARLPLADWDQLGSDTHGAFAMLHTADAPTATHRLFRERFKNLKWPKAAPTIAAELNDNTLTLTSPTFAWAVCLDATGEPTLADNYFDLLPGIPRALPWPTNQPAPEPRAANPRAT